MCPSPISKMGYPSHSPKTALILLAKQTFLIRVSYRALGKGGFPLPSPKAIFPLRRGVLYDTLLMILVNQT